MYVPGGRGRIRRRLTVPAATRDEALRLYAAFRAKIRAGATGKGAVAPTFCEFVAGSFHLIAANVTSKTAREYKYVIDRHLLDEFGERRLDEITSGLVNRFGAKLKAQGYAPATVNGYMSIVALLLGYAVDFDIVDELPLKKKLKKQKVDKPCLEMSPEEHAAFVKAFDDEAQFREYLRHIMPHEERRVVGTEAAPALFGNIRVYGAALRPDGDAAAAYNLRFRRSKSLFVTALETGLRCGDLARLKLQHIDFDENWIRLVMQKTRREVVVPISEACRSALKDAMQGRRLTLEDFIFVTEAGRPYSKSTIDRYFRIAKRLAGITRRLRIHDLRHTFGCDLATDGVPLQFIGKVMGHANPAMTARYARPDAVVLERVREALDRLRS